MHWDRIQRHWKDVADKVKEQWSKLTEADIVAVTGRRELLVAKIEQRYGVDRDEAARQVAAWQDRARDTWFW